MDNLLQMTLMATSAGLITFADHPLTQRIFEALETLL